jgi:thymidylate synthase ThyX
MEAALAASDYAEILLDLNLHKQTASRILEPFLWHTSVISSTSFSNCFEQRIHADAQPEFRVLALEMKKAIDESIPQNISYGEWHLPYLSEEDKGLSIDDKKKVCIARVARSSYLNQDKTDIDADMRLYERLASAEPPHLSPFEMVATPVIPGVDALGNFNGWHQMRHLL